MGVQGEDSEAREASSKTFPSRLNQGWKVTKYIYSTTVLNHNFQVLNLSISTLHYVVLQLIIQG